MGVCHDKLELVKFLLSGKLVDVNSTDNFGRTSLHYAASSGYLPIIVDLLAAGANLNQRNNAQETPLMKACSFGELETIKYFVERPEIEISNVDVVWSK